MRETLPSVSGAARISAAPCFQLMTNRSAHQDKGDNSPPFS